MCVRDNFLIKLRLYIYIYNRTFESITPDCVWERIVGHDFYAKAGFLLKQYFRYQTRYQNNL